jgi:hypothetical protein
MEIRELVRTQLGATSQKIGHKMIRSHNLKELTLVFKYSKSLSHYVLVYVSQYEDEFCW